MCTVTFIARRNGYCLGMNRDEKLTRPTGLLPKMKKMNGCTVISPSEPGGGTWIAVNDRGATLALINWYSITARVGGKAVSRGEVVNSMSAAISPDCAEAALHELPLNQINPFRLIGIYPAIGEVVEWRWDLKQLVRKRYRWKTQQWVSSGFDEPTAQRVRGNTFQRAGRQHSAGSLDWLRRLHRSHSPRPGPFSTCMHRADARTVSYTEVAVSPQEAVMRHHVGPLCHEAMWSAHHVHRRPDQRTAQALAIFHSFRSTPATETERRRNIAARLESLRADKSDGPIQKRGSPIASRLHAALPRGANGSRM